MSFDQAPIRRKLAFIVIVFALPIAMLAWLFISQSFKDISFAQKERDGVTYLRAIWPVVNTLITASNEPNSAPSSLLKALRATAAANASRSPAAMASR